MSITDFSLAAALTAVGDCTVFVGANCTVAGAMTPIGAIEGDVQENLSYDVNALTAPQHTGGVIHQARVVPGADLSITVPVIAGQTGLMNLLSPHGSEDGWGDNPVSVVEKAMWLVPKALLDAASGTLGYNGSSFSPGGIENNANMANCLLFMRCFLFHGPLPRPYANGGKGIVQLTIRPMYFAAGPTGKKVWIRGNPVAKGFTAFRA